MERILTRPLAATGAIALTLLTSACAHWIDGAQPAARSGVGLVLAKRGSASVVAELVQGGPAAEAGILPGDAVSSVDGTTTAGLSVSEVVALLVGPKGTEVELLIATFPTGTERVVFLKRSPVFLASVEPSLLDTETLYIRLRTFLPDTPKDIARVLRSHHTVSTLVLDLRSNSGGQLEPAVRTADLFLPVGAAIGSLESQRPSVAKSYISENPPIGEYADVFILVNSDTAAGAELFSLALRAAGIATIVGARTFGFGTVETRWPDSGRPPVVDGVLRGPGGTVFHQNGVEPDVIPPVDPSLIYPPESDPLVKWLLEHHRGAAKVVTGARVAAQQAAEADGRGLSRAGVCARHATW